MALVTPLSQHRANLFLKKLELIPVNRSAERNAQHQAKTGKMKPLPGHSEHSPPLAPITNRLAHQIDLTRFVLGRLHSFLSLLARTERSSSRRGDEADFPAPPPYLGGYSMDATFDQMRSPEPLRTPTLPLMHTAPSSIAV